MSSMSRTERAVISISPFLIGAVLWEAIARSGYFPPAFFPDLETIATTFVELLQSGVLITSALGTLSRLFLGFSFAVVIGITLGMMMSLINLSVSRFAPRGTVLVPSSHATTPGCDRSVPLYPAKECTPCPKCAWLRWHSAPP